MLNPIWRNVKQFDWPVVSRAVWETVMLRRFGPLQAAHLIAQVPDVPYQFYLDTGVTVYAGPERTFTPSSIPVTLPDAGALLGYDPINEVYFSEDFKFPGLRPRTLDDGDDRFQNVFSLAGSVDIPAIDDFEVDDCNGYSVSLSKITTPMTLVGNNQQAGQQSFAVRTNAGNFFAFHNRQEQATFGHYYLELFAKTEGTTPVQEQAAAYLALKLMYSASSEGRDTKVVELHGITNVDTGIAAVELVPDEGYDIYDALLDQCAAARDIDALAVLVTDATDGFSTAIRSQLSQDNLSFDSDEWRLINVPYKNHYQFEKLFARLGSDAHWPTDVGQVPDCTALTHITQGMLDVDEPEVDIHLSGILSLERFVPFYGKAVRDFAAAYSQASFHGEQALALESDRVFGKQIAQILGLDVPKSGAAKTLEDWLALKDSIPGEKVAVKYVKEHFIGIYTKAQVTHNFEAWAASQPTDTLYFEEYINTPDKEFNLCFIGVDKNIIPTMVLMEANRLMTNDTGGKSGNTLAIHDTRLGMYAELINPIIEAVTNYLGDHVEGIHGWFDLSLMVNPQGRVMVTEWCMRMGCSNNASIMRQMKSALPNVMADLRAGKDPQIQWHKPVTASVDIYSVPLSGGDNIQMQEADALLNYVPFSLAVHHAVFDPVDSAAIETSKGLMVFSGQRYGTVTGGDQEPYWAMHRAQVLAARSEGVLFAAYRPISSPQEFYKVFPFVPFSNRPVGEV